MEKTGNSRVILRIEPSKNGGIGQFEFKSHCSMSNKLKCLQPKMVVEEKQNGHWNKHWT
jgi:hypothetical protein